MRAYSICWSAVSCRISGISSRCDLHAAGGAVCQNLLEQDALVGHVLVDDPEAVAAGGNDEALVDLA